MNKKNDFLLLKTKPKKTILIKFKNKIKRETATICFF